MTTTIDLVSSNCVGDHKQDCLLLCDSHVILVLQNETHFDCASGEEDDDLILDELGKISCNKVCDCFLDVACYCLHSNTDFVSFEKMCKEKFDAIDN